MRLDDAMGVGDVDEVARPEGRRRQRDLLAPAHLACDAARDEQSPCLEQRRQRSAVAEHERVLEQRVELLRGARSLGHRGDATPPMPACLCQKPGVYVGVRATYAALMGLLPKERARDRIAALAGRGHDLVTFWQECTEVLAPTVPHVQKPCWYTLDPVSHLSTSHYQEGLL